MRKTNNLLKLTLLIILFIIGATYIKFKGFCFAGLGYL